MGLIVNNDKNADDYYEEAMKRRDGYTNTDSISVDSSLYGDSINCDSCGCSLEDTNSNYNNVYVITLINGGVIILCSKCALQLADNLCTLLAKDRHIQTLNIQVIRQDIP